MGSSESKGVRYERCPKCNAVIKFNPGESSTICLRCGVKIALK